MKLRPGFVLELAVNFLLPWLAYRLALPHLGETGALIASAVPPIVWSLIELVRFRRVDALSVMVVAGIVLSVAAMVLGGSPRVLLLRASLVSGAIGVVFLLSLPLRRPLLFYLARAGVYHTIKHWLDGRDGVVLMPAYHHGVEVEAVRATGARIRFYRVDRDMRTRVRGDGRRGLAPGTGFAATPARGERQERNRDNERERSPAHDQNACVKQRSGIVPNA